MPEAIAEKASAVILPSKTLTLTTLEEIYTGLKNLERQADDQAAAELLGTILADIGWILGRFSRLLTSSDPAMAAEGGGFADIVAPAAADDPAELAKGLLGKLEKLHGLLLNISLDQPDPQLEEFTVKAAEAKKLYATYLRDHGLD